MGPFTRKNILSNRILVLTSLSLQALWVYMINIAFSALAVLHLTYLGAVFNSSVDYMEEDEVRATQSTISVVNSEIISNLSINKDIRSKKKVYRLQHN